MHESDLSSLHDPLGSGRQWFWLLLAVVLAVFGRTVGFQFINYDDFLHVFENPLITGFSLETLARIWSGPVEGLYMPLTYTVWGCLAILSRLLPVGRVFPDPFWYHAANLLVHLVAVSVVFLLLRQILRDKVGALAGALLFAIHPLQVESVAWVSALKGLLGGLFSLISVWFYLRFVSASERTEHQRYFYYGLAGGSFGLGLLSSPMAVTAPLLAAAVGRLATGRSWPRLFKELLPWLLMALPLMVVTKHAQPDATQIFWPAYSQRFLVAGDALSFYLGKLLWPAALGPDYGRRPLEVLAEKWVYLTALLPLLLAALLVWKCRQTRIWLAVGLLVLPLLPVLGFIPFTFQNISTVADRYFYLSMTGPALLLGWLLARYRSRWLTGLVVLLLVLLAGRSVLLLGNWRDSYTLNRHALEVNPESGTAAINLGVAYMDEGRAAEAIAQYRRAIEVAPYKAEAYINLGNIYDKDGKYDQAAGYYLQALSLSPDEPRVAYQLGDIFRRQGNLATAMLYFRKAVGGAPGNFKALVNLGEIARELGRQAEASEYYRQALALEPDSAEVYSGLGQLYGDMGRIDDAAASFSRAIAINPDLGEAYNKLGELYLENNQAGKAIAPLQKASQIYPGQARSYRNLARAWLLLGREDLAATYVAKAMTLEPAAGEGR
jgi:tetratricopeptide (TPR) repeat protein